MTWISAVLSRVGPKIDSLSGRSTASGASRSPVMASSTRSAGLSTSMWPRSRLHSSACHTWSLSSGLP